MHQPATEKDFKPPAYEAGGVKKGDKCSRLALSFFDSVQSAQMRFAVLAERIDMEAKHGAWIGEIDLTKGDGVMALPNAIGHFDLHEEESATFLGRVLRYTSVYPGAGHDA